MNAQVKFALTVLFIGGSFAAGYALKNYLHPQPTPEAPAPLEPVVETVTITNTADTLALSRANTQIAELTAERDALRTQLEAARLAAKEAEAALAAQPTPAPAEPEEEPRLSPAERMERLRQEDPERYAEVQRRREQFHQQMMQARENRDNFLNDVDLSLMTPEQQEVHLAYTEALARQNELAELMRAKFESGEPFTEEERAAMFENRDTVRQLQRQERTALLNAVGTSMGFTAEESEDFAALIEEVYSATQGNGMRRPPRGGNDMPPPPPPGA